MDWKLVIGVIGGFTAGLILGKIKVNARTCPAMRNAQVREAIRRIQEDSSDGWL